MLNSTSDTLFLITQNLSFLKSFPCKTFRFTSVRGEELHIQENRVPNFFPPFILEQEFRASKLQEITVLIWLRRKRVRSNEKAVEGFVFQQTSFQFEDLGNDVHY